MLCFDLETYRDDSAVPLLPPCSAPANYKDVEKIAAAIAERTCERNAKLALDPDCCRIVVLGYTQADGGITVHVCRDEEEEAQALRDFWLAWSVPGQRPIGFNCVGFDLPVLIQRSRILGVAYPRVTLRKYGSPDCEDLMLDLSFGGISDYKSLDFWCRRLALEVPDDRTSGKDIAAMVEADHWAGIEAHCRADIAKTAALAQRVHPGVL